jgi:hypothetical protein
MIDALAKGYSVNIFDYHRDSTGLLVSSGAGTMCAVMDACPVFRWCLDIDQTVNAEHLASFLFAADLLVDPLAVVGWFSITPPDPLQAALRRLPNLGRVLAYTQQATMPAGFHFSDLGAFIAAANDFKNVTKDVLVERLSWRAGKRDDTTRASFRVNTDENAVFDSAKEPLRANRQKAKSLGVARSQSALEQEASRPAV